MTLSVAMSTERLMAPKFEPLSTKIISAFIFSAVKRSMCQKAVSKVSALDTLPAPCFETRQTLMRLQRETNLNPKGAEKDCGRGGQCGVQQGG